jgi:Holliday junction resolvase RusA-like endonuclease
MRIPFRLPSLNEYVDICRRDKYGANAHKQEIENDISYFIHGRHDGPVTIQFTWYEPNRRRDVDNVAFAKKYILDAMQKKGVLKNDRQVVGFTDSFVYGQGEGVNVVITDENSQK